MSAKKKGPFYYMVQDLKKQEPFSRKLKYLHFYQLARKNGVVPFRLNRIASEYTADYYADTGVPRRKKGWYYRRGIQTYKTNWDGLTKKNYRDYISDFDFYHKDNYTNERFVKWFDHKLSTYFVLSPFRNNMPQHYYYLSGGVLHPLDVEPKVAASPKDLLPMIQQSPKALKRCSGGHGVGFYKLEYRSGEGYFANRKPIGEEELLQILRGAEDYIFTEYCVPHSSLRALCGEGALAVLRVITVFDPEQGAQVTGMMIRLGTKKSGVVTDYDDQICAGVSLEDGSLFDAFIRTGLDQDSRKRSPIQKHPDTGNQVNGFVLPEFDQLIDLAKHVSLHLSMTPYLCMDIVPADDGYKILEINSHGQVIILEPFYPFNKNPMNRKAFRIREW